MGENADQLDAGNPGHVSGHLQRRGTGRHTKAVEARVDLYEHGDIDHVVSITTKEDGRGVTLVSFKRGPLEQYLAASDSSLMRMFDFTLLRRGSFSGWPDGPEDLFTESDDFFYRQKIAAGHAA